MTRDVASAAALHHALGAPALDDRTWRDLALDAVFARLDRCATAVGAQTLYARLRGSRRRAELTRFDERVRAFGGEGVRRGFEDAVKPLALERSASLAPVLWGESPVLPRAARLYPVATAVTLAAAVASAIWPIALLLFIGLVIGNIALRLQLHSTMTAYGDALATVAALATTSLKVAALESDALGPDLARLRGNIAAIAPWRSSLAWATLDAGGLNEIIASALAYINVFFLIDVNAFVASLRLLRERGAALRTMFEIVGELDAARAIALFRAENAHSVPTFAARGAPIMMTGMRHPLVDDAVPNDVLLDERGWLVLGSNASGKSTCLKGIALQAVLAQSIATTTCAAYSAPPLRVRTLIHVEDDLARGRSHFQVEAEAVRDMLRACEDAGDGEDATEDHLCIVDELFRGTNTRERIAAGAAVLRGLRRRGAHVVAATHDDELIALLAADFAPLYFTEDVTSDTLVFDYRLQHGHAAPRNALKVLKLAGVPEDVVSSAYDVAAG